MAESGGPDLEVIFPSLGNPGEVSFRSHEDLSVYEKAAKAIKEIADVFDGLEEKGIVSGVRAVMFGGASNDLRPATDVDVILLYDNFNFERYLASWETFDDKEREAVNALRFSAKYQTDHRWDIPVTGIPSKEQFPAAFDIHVMPLAAFESDLKESRQECRGEAIEALLDLINNDKLDRTIRDKLVELRDSLSKIDVTKDADFGEAELLASRGILSGILEDPNLSYQDSKRVRSEFRNFSKGDNFAKVLVNSGSVLIKGANPVIDGHRVFLREDEEFLK